MKKTSFRPVPEKAAFVPPYPRGIMEEQKEARPPEPAGKDGKMTRQELIDYIFDEYSVEPDFPFQMDDVTCVFRHAGNRRWFGIAMCVPCRTLGMNRDGSVDVLNVKCDPILAGSLRGKPGFRPAYHMNKDKWISVLLDGSVERGDITALLAMSYSMTAPKIRKRNGKLPETGNA